MFAKLRSISCVGEESTAYKHAELAGQISDGLQDEGFRVAMDMGVDAVYELGGIKK